MILTVFRSRLNEEALDEYYELVPKIVAIAEAMPGFRSRKSFVAEDGERLSLVEFEDEESHRNWAYNAEHIAAKERGRTSFYSEYVVQICQVVRESRFKAK
ncbi:MAG TPA: antibiotic biosynthesis monooxygenase [Spongiibacteraceae bacterium]|nr:antibiotic biosynthesis monooxygenase [Spongiibacteraceae bacterium]